MLLCFQEDARKQERSIPLGCLCQAAGPEQDFCLGEEEGRGKAV